MKEDLQHKQELLQAMRTERSKLTEEIKYDQERVQANEKIDQDIKANIEFREREKDIVEHQKKVRQTDEIQSLHPDFTCTLYFLAFCLYLSIACVCLCIWIPLFSRLILRLLNYER